MEEIEIGSAGMRGTASGTGLATSPSMSELEVLNVNAEAADGDDTINAVFARIDSDYWDSDDDLIISPVFKGTDTLAYIDDLESGEVPILYQKFWDPYEDVTVTLFSITPRLTHAEINEEELGPLVEESLIYGQMTAEDAQLALEAIENLSELAQQRTNISIGI